MRLTRQTLTRLLPLLALWFPCLGCQRSEESPPSPRQTPPASELDTNVWRDELLAQQHEQTWVQLSDDLRRAQDKVNVLAEFAFETIHIPRPKGPPETLRLGIRRQGFDDTRRATLTHDGWRNALAQFQKAGWSVVQTEWQHEKFTPPTATRAATSEFAFEIHGEQANQTNRFILKGTLEVACTSAREANTLLQPHTLVVRELSLLERTGPPGFNNHLLIAPEPDRPNGQVNLHPVIVTDINGDGHVDIVLASINKVLRNDGRATFQTTALITPDNFYALQNVGLIADFTGDQKLDLLGVGDLGPRAKMLMLYPGNGSLPFASPPVAAWAAQETDFETLHLTAASVITAADADRDGDLDLFIAQYRPPYIGGQLPTPYYDSNDGYPSYFLLNDGRGRFSVGPRQPALLAKQHRRTLAGSFVDLDTDGDRDLVTLNDYSGLDVYYNDGQGHFADETARLGNRYLFGMGLSFGDFDYDGALDIFATGMSIPTVHRLDAMRLAPKEFPDRTQKRTDMGYGNRLYVARDGRWIEPPWAGQLARSGWSWGVSTLDLDNGGRLDLYIANGHVSGESIADYDSHCWMQDIYRGSSREDPALKRYLDIGLKGLNSGKTSWAGYLHNVLFVDVGTNHYVNAAFLMGLAHESDCRAVVTADLNEDGRQDLIVTEAIWMGTPNIMRHRLLVHLNQLESSNHWLAVQLGPTAGVSPLGARISLRAGARRYAAQIVSGDSFQIQQPNEVHFGLGAATQVDELNVVWPNGRTNSIKAPAVDRVHRLTP